MLGRRHYERIIALYQILYRHAPPRISEQSASLLRTNHRPGMSTWCSRALVHGFALLFLFVVCDVSSARAQSSYAPVVITPPIIDMVDENHVSILSGRTQLSVPAVKLGDVSFAPFAYKGTFFTHAGLQDNNYGSVVGCSGAFGQGAVVTPQCSVSSSTEGVQVQFGEERETFFAESSGPPYMPQNFDGANFVDNVNTNGTCTWTKRDGTKIVFAGYHQASGSQVCLSYNILSVTYPDGRILTYYYYGSFNQSGPTPIISIASNSGYLLKYNYSGTPAYSMQTSVTAINRSYESCDPAAVSCSLQHSWPTATLTWQLHTVSPCDGFYVGPGDCIHTTFTVQDAALRHYVFELDSTSRVISYQPPDATGAVYSYTLCSQLLTGVETCCPPPAPGGFDARPLYTDLVSSVTRNGQTWSYSSSFSTGAPPGHGDWRHDATTPLGMNMWATGNATPGSESLEGPIDSITHYDGTVDKYERSARNVVISVTTPAGVVKTYAYDYGENPGSGRANLTQITQTPISGSGLPNLVETASYPEVGVYPCVNIVTCNKPTAVVDANSHETDYTYASTHGGVLTQTDPAGPNGIRPEIVRTYLQHHAWYLNSSGTMTEDSHPIWLLATESTCQKTAVSGSSCVGGANDKVVTSYDYGPNSGPNNLLLRGKTVAGYNPVPSYAPVTGTYTVAPTIQTLRTCYAHDMQGNKIWETSANANPSSCPAY